MADRLRVDARRNKELLLNAAREVFGKEGTEASLREVARQAGVGIGTLYRHFPTREALLETLLRNGVEQLRDRAGELARTLPPEQALITWLREYVDRSCSYQGLPASVTNALYHRKSDLFTAASAMQAAGAELLARAQEAGAIRTDITANDLFAVVSGVALAVDQMPGGRGYVDRLLSLAMTGLRGRP
ncbi:helix-turn-helix domain-containing protein [Actinocrispum sp. NPDC049592]|uniref:TetR/AcrR family transcriptional regulator n=1 Tax=Actinocrispum sp. NPDC049592 TaxID=3154835 RepID=UPI00341A9966